MSLTTESRDQESPNSHGYVRDQSKISIKLYRGRIMRKNKERLSRRFRRQSGISSDRHQKKEIFDFMRQFGYFDLTMQPSGRSGIVPPKVQYKSIKA